MQILKEPAFYVKIN